MSFLAYSTVSRIAANDAARAERIATAVIVDNLKQTSTSTRCQGGSWTCRFGEERGHFKELEFDPEPLGSVEKRGEHRVIGRQTAEAKV